ncbi:hypothetical protein LCGC14_2877740 [marine sediment metagenome]|uniref:DUF6438 domain-containing protein n=1 Tax=marine sediment metagenome TaxID=412755 RepID=A0A0F9A949_9ZZZZ|nr:hypothetical protein [Bacteroides sp.]
MYYKISCLRGINAFLIVFVSLQIISCTGSSKFTADKLLIEMEKTSCYGQCPVYTVKIDGDGNGLFKGVENTDYVGLFTFRISTDELSRLISSFEEVGFYDLEDRYYKNVTDLPTVYLTYRKEGKEKRIMDYYGAPQALKSLEKKIQSLVLSKKMKKVE